MKIKFSDKKSKSKVLIEYHTKKNYFYAQIMQSIINGVCVYSPSKEQLNYIDPNINRVLKMNGVSFDGMVNSQANISYFCELARKNTKQVYTKDDYSRDKIIAWDIVLNTYKIVEKQVGKTLGIIYIKYFKEYITEDNDLYKFKNDYKKSYDHWEKQVYRFASNRFNGKRLLNHIKEFFDSIEEYKKLVKKYQYSEWKLPSNWELWTYDRLSNYLNVTKRDLAGVAMSNQDNFNDEVLALIEVSQKKTIKILNDLIVDLKLSV